MSNRVTHCKVGLFSIGLTAYWPQFPGLRARLEEYASFVAGRLRAAGAHVIDAGMVDDPDAATKAADLFLKGAVDLVICYVATYSTSSQVVLAVLPVKRPVLILNLQPTAQLNYAATGTAEWLANCQACCVPEIACAFERCSINFHTVSGVLGLTEQPPHAVADEITADHPAAVRAWAEITEWLEAARIRRSLSRSRIGFLGHTYPGMLDMYSDFTQLTGQLGLHVEILEMDDLQERVAQVTEEEIEQQKKTTEQVFRVADDSSSDPLAHRPKPEELRWAFQVSAGLERLVQDFSLDGLTYYHRGVAGNDFEKISAGMILGCSLLTGQGIPCSGEGDLKNCVAMKVLDTLAAGGSFSELYAMDFQECFVLMGHDGPFHPKISEGRPVLRGLGLYHGKRGRGVSVEARVRQGPVTILGLTQTRGGLLKWVCSEGWSLPGETLQIGNTNSRLRFTPGPDDPFDVPSWMNRWSGAAPTHHVALGVGHHSKTLKKLADSLHQTLEVV